MPRESCPGLLLTLVSIFVGLCESFAAGGATSGTQQPQPQPQQQHPVCKPGLEFWSTERASCWPCTRCAPDFTLSPCAVHKDAICGSLELDYASGTPKWSSEAGEKAFIAKFWRLLETKQRVSTVETGNLDQDRDDDEGSGDEKPVYSASRESKTAHDPRERRKSATEADQLPWDWQTGALVLAVCACIVFFLVAGCSALVYARQWRRMKKNFEPAGLEEISARLNLMVKAELAELVAGAPMNPGDPETRCQYLEKLLDRKRETPVVTTATTATGWPEAAAGNLYIEEGSTMTPTRSKRSQIARIQRNIETILSHKTNQATD
ncbi:tumor necrosis factor receptor superfamily member wengen [Camponotus floridanus]|nr:tumor necrosis factor receptor superfamily member wengen [Camponotus floridanus]XP_025263340.1 tumor necrosis factor receptor superfamily member wengen [Camponotus floridanus]